jgi:hypothetical protein
MGAVQQVAGALLAALPGADGELVGVGVDVVQLQRDELRHPQPGGERDAEQGAVAIACRACRVPEPGRRG